MIANESTNVTTVVQPNYVQPVAIQKLTDISMELRIH